MSRRNRIFLGVLAVYALGVAYLLFRIAGDLDARYRESAEETLVDAANVLAAMVEIDPARGTIEVSRLRSAFADARRRELQATIFGLTKSRVDLRVYVTDANGTVLFDSEGRDEGKDFRAWRDVRLTLEGGYGARTTRDAPDNPTSSIMYVAAPIRDGERILGVLSVGKPVAAQGELVASARQKLFNVGLIVFAAVVVLLVVVSVWLARPVELIADLLRVVRSEGRRRPGDMARRAGILVAGAYRDMRDALAGRSYTEEYIEALTHELKSPISAIRGAAELLAEPTPQPMPESQRRRFVANIDEQARRLQDLADRLLELAHLEKRRALEHTEPVSLGTLAEEAAAGLEPAARRKALDIRIDVPHDLHVEGDPFLIQRALSNLLVNAIDFSPTGGTVEVGVQSDSRHHTLAVRDHGPGIPEYALERAFDKFYSLRRPDSGKKSTGLGLPFVREIAHLHGGQAYLANHREGGAVASLRLPRSDTAA